MKGINRKCKGLILALAMVASLVLASAAMAWHVNDVTVSVACNSETQTFDLTATIVQSSQYPGAYIHTFAPDSFPWAQAGKTKQVTIVVKWPNSNDTQVLHRNVFLGATCEEVTPPEEPPVVTPPVDPPVSQGNRAGYCSPVPVLRADGTYGTFLDLPVGDYPGLVPAYVDANGAITCDFPQASSTSVTPVAVIIKTSSTKTKVIVKKAQKAKKQIAKHVAKKQPKKVAAPVEKKPRALPPTL